MSKKWILFSIVVTVLLLFTCSLGFVNAALLYGDSNFDGAVNSTDYLVMKRHILGLAPIDNLSTSDLNGDGQVNSTDFLLMKKYLLGIISEFPVQEVVPSSAPITPAPSLALTYPPLNYTPTVYIAGDSTVQTYAASAAPQQGWGQRIGEFFTSNVKFVNKSIGGRSSKSFVTEGRLDEILSQIKENDYLFVQLGINDRYKSDPARYTEPYTTYKQYIKMYIDGALAKKAIPVLITPTVRLDYSNGQFQNGFTDYCIALKQLAADTNTKLIDLQTKGLNYYTSIGYNEVLKLYMTNDVLHFNDKGAYQMAKFVAEGVKEINVPISQYVRIK